MEIFQDITPNKHLALGLGYFDGIHEGHKKIIQILVDEAKKRKTKSAVITFKKNPSDYFKKQCTLNIQSLSARSKILESLGVDYLYELDFEKFKNLSAEEYLNEILIKNFEPKIIMAGYNHTFGKQKGGNSVFLKEKSKNLNFDCLIVPEQKINNKKISSTIIRKNIQLGNLDDVSMLLGRYFSIENIVIKGDEIASGLGFPTANIKWDDKIIKLPYGVYFGFVNIDSKTRPALISWGVKATLCKEKKETLEAHIYDFCEDIYGKNAEIFFVKKLRNQEKFENIDFLKKQIQKDYDAFKIWVKSSKNDIFLNKH